jgi:exopolyphosphatase / guanosine-5'-triphosphate,3'-diphosphate pyrophosphatase
VTLRVAAIDIGTNSVLLLVMERASDGIRRVLVDTATVTRLGRGVDLTHCLSAEAITETLDCLRGYAAMLKNLDVQCLRVVGTSALRDAGASAGAFLTQVEVILGQPPRVIDGSVEAALTFRGAVSGLGLAGAVSVLDVGGGSTEIVFGQAWANEPAMEKYYSVDVGCVRLHERHVKTDPLTPEAGMAIAADVERSFHSVVIDAQGVPLVAVGGTATTLAAIHLGLAVYDSAQVHGCALSRHQVQSLVEWLSRMPLAERAAVGGIDPRRADIIVVGGIVLEKAMDVMGSDCMVVSDRGVRFGLVDALLDSCM